MNQFLKTIRIKGDAQRYRIVRKGSFLLLFDEELQRIITSFERLKSPEVSKPNNADECQSSQSHRNRKKKNNDRRGKRERPSWRYDSHSDLSYIDVGSASEGWERGHIASYGNHKETEETEKESCYYTNAFLQVKRFHAYRFVEEWSRQIFWKFKDVIVVTHLLYENSDHFAGNLSMPATNRQTNRPPVIVYKILIWRRASPDETSVMIIFEFPNRKNHKAIGSTNINTCSQFLKSEEVLKNLPFSFDINMYSPLPLTAEDMNKVVNWKNALNNAVKRYANTLRRERTGNATRKEEEHGFKAIIQPHSENEKSITDHRLPIPKPTPRVQSIHIRDLWTLFILFSVISIC